jgi:pyruvate kinase
MRRARIFATLGPAVASPEKIEALIDAGMNVARLNMSHGDHEVHTQSYEMVRKASKNTGAAVGILADLQGPKIRLGKFKDDMKVKLKVGDPFIITTKDYLLNDV